MKHWIKFKHFVKAGSFTWGFFKCFQQIDFLDMIINIKNDGVFSEFETADRSGTSGGRNSTLMSQDPIKTPSGMESAVKDESFRSAIPSVCPA